MQINFRNILVTIDFHALNAELKSNKFRYDCPTEA